MLDKPWITLESVTNDLLTTGDATGLKAYLEAGGSPNILCGNAPLMFYVVNKGDGDVLKLLLAYGADPNGRTSDDSAYPPLLNAAICGNATIVRMLLDAGADVNAQNIQGDTAIYGARDQDHLEVAKLLLEAGADPRIENDGGFSAVNLTKKRARTDRVGELLKAAGYDIVLIANPRPTRFPPFWVPTDTSSGQ